MDNFLIDSLDLNLIVFKKPRKHSDYLVCKVKYNDADLNIQFPKMMISSEENQTGFELEFINGKGYNKDVYNFLNKLDNFIIDHVSEKSEEWFQKKIPKEPIKKMYNSFIKAPKTTENKCTLNFSFKNKETSLFLDKKDNEISKDLFKKNEIVECIAQFKYLIFSKDTCFCTWEIVSSKLHRKTQKVPKFGFIEDPDEVVEESDDEDISITRFF